MNKKAQSMSINVIIIAAIALIVLVVLVAIFTGRLGLFGKDVSNIGQECKEFVNSEDQSASWMSSSCPDGYTTKYTALDANDHPDESCCLLDVTEE